MGEIPSHSDTDARRQRETGEFQAGKPLQCCETCATGARILPRGPSCPKPPAAFPHELPPGQQSAAPSTSHTPHRRAHPRGPAPRPGAGGSGQGAPEQAAGTSGDNRAPDSPTPARRWSEEENPRTGKVSAAVHVAAVCGGGQVAHPGPPIGSNQAAGLGSRTPIHGPCRAAAPYSPESHAGTRMSCPSRSRASSSAVRSAAIGAAENLGSNCRRKTRSCTGNGHGRVLLTLLLPAPLPDGQGRQWEAEPGRSTAGLNP